MGNLLPILISFFIQCFESTLIHRMTDDCVICLVVIFGIQSRICVRNPSLEITDLDMIIICNTNFFLLSNVIMLPSKRPVKYCKTNF